MAAGNWIVYDGFKEYLGDGTIDLDGDTFKMKLLTSGYTPALTHDVVADLTNESADGDYAEQTLASVTWTKSGSTTTFDAADESFGDPVTITAKYAVIYDDTVSSPIVDPLVCYVDLDTGGGSVSSTASSFSVNMNASGILTLSGAIS